MTQVVGDDCAPLALDGIQWLPVPALRDEERRREKLGSISTNATTALWPSAPVSRTYFTARERLFAWLLNFRRLVTRWEWHAENYLGFVKLGCILILLRHL